MRAARVMTYGRMFAVLMGLILFGAACTDSNPYPQPSSPVSVAGTPSAEAQATPVSSSADGVAAALFQAQEAGDRELAKSVASERVVHLLLDPVAEGGNPEANSLGSGPRPCIAAQRGFICYFRDSVVKVLVRVEGNGAFRAWAALFPLGTGTSAES